MNLSAILLFYALGLLGIVIHIIKAVLKQRSDDKLSALVAYINAHQLSTLCSVLTYTGVVTIWATAGIDLIGLKQGALNGMVIILAYVSDSLFDLIASKVAPASIDVATTEAPPASAGVSATKAAALSVVALLLLLPCVAEAQLIGQDWGGGRTKQITSTPDTTTVSQANCKIGMLIVTHDKLTSTDTLIVTRAGNDGTAFKTWYINPGETLTIPGWADVTAVIRRSTGGTIPSRLIIVWNK